MKKQYLVLLFIIIIAAFLRIYKLGLNPPALYWDEASLGYNAFSILTTGHDEHGEFLPLARFIAFGDYKPPGYIYSIVPFMALFGVTEFAIRFPSALAGILMVLLTYILAVKLTKNPVIGLIASGLIAISPWSLQLSRAAFEAHLAALLNLLAVLLFIYFPKRKWLLPLSLFLFVLAFYTFNANRIISPLLLLLLFAIYFKEIWQSKKWVLISGVLGIILILPSITYLQSRESRLRFQEVSIFTSLNTVRKANERIERSGNTLWAKLIHNRRVYFARDFLSHYFDNFKGEFLFIKGDENPRLSTLDIGHLYLFEAPFLIIGLYLVLKRRDKMTALLFGWMLIAPIPAATARETPHMLRIASILPTFYIFTAIGLSSVYFYLRKWRRIRLVSIILFSLVVLMSFAYYQHNYWVHYPREWSTAWQYGYKELVSKVSRLEKNYDTIYVTEALGRPYIYFLLYNKINPLEYVRTRDANRDWYGFWNVYGFGKYRFTGPSKLAPGKNLFVTIAGGFSGGGTKVDEVKDMQGNSIFEIGEK